MKQKRWVKKLLIVFGSVLVIVAGGAAAFAGYLYRHADHALANMSAAEPAAAEPESTHTTTTGDEAATDKPVTFLLTAVDSREGSGGTLNTDVIMLIAWNPASKAATVVSLPRDLELKPKGFNPHKANYFYAYYYERDTATAMAETKRLYGDLLHVPIDYMAVVNFDGFRQVVDKIGGLALDIDMDMRYVDYSDGTDINLKKGPQTLNGKQTLDFVRYRKSNRQTAESSDTARNERQQQVLNAIMGKLATARGATKWGDILDILGNNVKTDIPVKLLRGWLFDLPKHKPEQVEFIHLDGEWISPYIVPKESDMLGALGSLRSRIGLSGTVGIEDLATVAGVLKDHATDSAAAGSAKTEKAVRQFNEGRTFQY